MNQAVIVKSDQQLSMPIRDYAQFYQFYLTEHSNVISRRLHVAGSVAGIYCVYKTIRTGKKSYLVKGLLTGYTCAWVGHFFFEKNKPASFTSNHCIALYLTGVCLPWQSELTQC